MFENILNKIGLSTKEAKVYLTSLQIGSQPASIIANKAGLNRSTAYVVLNSLLKKGLVSQFIKADVKYFLAVSPEYLIQYIDRLKRDIESQKSEIESLLPEFKSLSIAVGIKPKVKFFEGLEGIKAVFEDTLTCKSEIYCYTSIDALLGVLEDYIRDYTKRKSLLHIPTKTIVPFTEKAKKYNEEFYEDRGSRSIPNHRFIPSDKYIFKNEINIYDDKVAIMSLNPDELIAVVIQSQDIVDTQKAVFDLAWKGAKVYSNSLTK